MMLTYIPRKISSIFSRKIRAEKELISDWSFLSRQIANLRCHFFEYASAGYVHEENLNRCQELVIDTPFSSAHWYVNSFTHPLLRAAAGVPCELSPSKVWTAAIYHWRS